MKKLLLGNYAVARGVYEAGATVAVAYPGTPSTEITEEIATYSEIYAQWAPNEKVALEVGIGASLGGARTIVSMKHVGLNVAADPMFTFSYTGVNGGLVIAVADDPGMHSSQNEQDSRYYALSAQIPMIEPSDSSEAKDFTKLAFDISEQFDTPVLLRLTTRVAHSRSLVEINDKTSYEIKPYVKQPQKYVMVPALAKKRHIVVEQRNKLLKEYSENSPLNFEVIKDTSIGIVCAGITYQYVLEALPNASVFKIGVVNPLPIEKIKQFARKVDKLIVIEELEPIIENQLKANGINVVGKEIFSVQGEIPVNEIKLKLLGEKVEVVEENLPDRPPVLCPGCSHRGIFYTLKKHDFVVSGDIGCYSLGALAPLAAVDSVICMGASIPIAMGLQKARGEKFAKKTVAVIGDSTFVHSGITGLIDAVYNRGIGTVIILDNSTTGMTGHQNHPATGLTIKNEPTHMLNLELLCKAIGVSSVVTVDAYKIDEFEKALLEETSKPCVSVIIARQPCVLLGKTKRQPCDINDNCKNCKACMKIGCPALSVTGGKVVLDKAICTGCGVCKFMCKFSAICEK